MMDQVDLALSPEQGAISRQITLSSRLSQRVVSMQGIV